MQYFWLDCTKINCVRQSIFFACIILTSFFNLISLINTLQYYRKMKFQFLPLTINTLVSFILIFLSLVEISYQFFTIIGIMEIYSYFLFTFTFAYLSFRQQKDNKNSLQKLKKLNRTMKSIFIVITCLMIGASISIIILAKKIDCNDNSLIESIILGIQSILYICTLYFCFNIRNRINRISSRKVTQDQQDLSQSVKDDHLFNESDAYLEIRFKQIKYLIISFTISIVLNILSLIQLVLDFIPIHCKTINNQIQILFSQSNFGFFLLTLSDVSKLIPHIFIPIILYVIPIYNYNKYKDNAIILLKKQSQNSGSGSEPLLRPNYNIIQNGKIQKYGELVKQKQQSDKQIPSDLTLQFAAEEKIRQQYYKIKNERQNEQK